MSDSNSSEFQFIKETIKERPLNKRKLLMQLIMLVICALIFGTVSASVFVMAVRQMTPVPEETASMVNIPRDDKEDPGDTAPSVSLSEDNAEAAPTGDISEEASTEETTEEETASTAATVESTPSEEGDGSSSDHPDKPPQGNEDGVSAAEIPPANPVSYITEKTSLSVDDYKDLYRTLKEVATETARSLVTVTAITSDKDWFDNSYENSHNTAGLIVANNGKDLLILTDMPNAGEEVELNITFCDETTLEGEVKSLDESTGLAIISVPLESISEETKNAIVEATLGNSRGSNIVGMPVMALGSPLGIQGSQCFGRTTSNQREISMVDRNVHILSTDIYGSKNATGVITNYDGQIMGIISRNTSLEDAPNLLTAYAISDIKGLIEKLSNNSSEAYIGIFGADVTDEVNKEEGVPKGLYITRVALDSPAMSAGIQSGDVMTRFGTSEITSIQDYMEQMMKYQPGDEAVITVQRFSQGEYQEMTFEVEIDDAGNHV